MTAHVVVSIYDKAAGLFQNPIFVPAIGVGVRLFCDELNRPADDNILYRHYKDFALYEMGYFDPSNGTFSLLEKPSLILEGEAAKTE